MMFAFDEVNDGGALSFQPIKGNTRTSSGISKRISMQRSEATCSGSAPARTRASRCCAIRRLFPDAFLQSSLRGPGKVSCCQVLAPIGAYEGISLACGHAAEIHAAEVSFKPITPAMINAMHPSLAGDALSENSTMPSVATPTAPIPVQTA